MKKGKKAADEFCSCIKKVKKSLRNQNRRKGIYKKVNDYEQGGIAICVKSMLQSKGRTLKKFHCKKSPMLKTQSLLK